MLSLTAVINAKIQIYYTIYINHIYVCIYRLYYYIVHDIFSVLLHAFVFVVCVCVCVCVCGCGLHIVCRLKFS